MKFNKIIKRSSPYIFIPTSKPKFSSNHCPCHINNVDNCLDCFEYKMALKEDQRNRAIAVFNPISSHLNTIKMFRDCDYSLALTK